MRVPCLICSAGIFPTCFPFLKRKILLLRKWMLINHVLPSFVLCSSILFEKYNWVDVGKSVHEKQSLMFMTILEYSGKPSEGFSLFSAGNVLWLIKAC